jgi:Ca-activated chloride channel family protein
MHRFIRLARAFSVIVASVACLGPGVEAWQGAAFRAGVDLVVLSVTATGPGGKYVTDLAAEDFTVLEDGKPQTVALFERANSPLAVSLLLDSSTSMIRELPLAQKAASDFVTRLRADDVAQVVDFDRRVQVLQPFTGDRAALDRAIYRVEARGSTSMYNAIYIALRELGALGKPAAGKVRRDVIVVLSDGEDTSSLVTYDHVLDGAKRSQSVIYAIGLGFVSAPTRRDAVHPDFALRTLAQETGGRLFLARDGTSLLGVYNEIADELASQYVLGYTSTNSQRSGWRRISVRVARPSTQARTRAGYFANSGAAAR